MKTVITGSRMLSPYGAGIDPAWNGLIAGESAIRKEEEFAGGSFMSEYTARVPNLALKGRSRLFSMVAPLIDDMRREIPQDSAILLATTVGEIDLLEKSIADNNSDAENANPKRLLNDLRNIAAVKGPGAVVSAACASSSAAVERAASMIREERADSVLVIGCDAVSEFVFAGFSALMALAPGRARPFDRNRDGLTVGESACAALLMSEERALSEGRKILAEISGCGMSSDAHHMTAPSREGGGLVSAIQKALRAAAIEPARIGSVSAHGTGTDYNDAMELKAFRRVFDDNPPPVYSIKGGTGHTMGAAGLLEILIAVESLRKEIAPPTTGLVDPEDEADGMVSGLPIETPGAEFALSTNSGFGGINAAIIIKKRL